MKLIVKENTTYSIEMELTRKQTIALYDAIIAKGDQIQSANNPHPETDEFIHTVNKTLSTLLYSEE